VAGGGRVTIGRSWRLAALLAIAVVTAVTPAAAEVGAPTAISACGLFRTSDVLSVLGSPASIRHGASASDCVLYGGQLLPVVVLANSSGKRGYRNLIRAAAVPVKPLKGVGTEAVMYDHVFDEPQSVIRAVIVRKAGRVLQLSTSDVGINPPGLPRLAQLIALARIGVRRL
jgi:hypothetical protein